MNWSEQAQLLLEKARQDLYLAGTHENDRQLTDETWGFHAQQAAEKLLKALLSQRQQTYPFTHRLRTLAELLEMSGDALSPELEPLLDLTPYAAELRYSILPRDHDEPAIDRSAVLLRLRALEGYVQRQIRGR